MRCRPTIVAVMLAASVGCKRRTPPVAPSVVDAATPRDAGQPSIDAGRPAQPVVVAVDVSPTTDVTTVDDGGASAPVCESDLPSPRRETVVPVTTFPEPVEPAVVRSCSRLLVALRRRAGRLFGLPSDATIAVNDAPLFRCHGAGLGAWSFAIDRVALTPASSTDTDEEGTSTHTITLHPVFIAQDGSLHPSAARIDTIVSDQRYAETVDLLSFGVHDWDGDGRGELYFASDHRQHEAHNEVARSNRWWIFTPRTPRPTELVADGDAIHSIEDIDGDGHLDLVTKSPWTLLSPCGVSGIDIAGPSGLRHARSDGHFDDDDETVHRYLAAQCRVRPEALFEHVENDSESVAESPAFLVACGRWWGRSTEAMRAQITSQYPPPPEEGDPNPMECHPREELLRIAAIAPPLAFRLHCPGQSDPESVGHTEHDAGPMDASVVGATETR